MPAFGARLPAARGVQVQVAGSIRRRQSVPAKAKWLKALLYVANRIRKGTVEEINAVRWKKRARLA
jgi:hypothetical protein